MNAHHHSEPSSFRKMGPEALVVFAQGLAGLPPEEVRKLKVLYVRNTLTELKAEIQNLEANFRAGCIHWCIPLFWPMAWAARNQISIARQRGRELFTNLLEAWQGDLGDAEFDYAFLEEPEPPRRGRA